MQAVAPREIIKGYRFSFGYTVHGGEVLAQRSKAENPVKHVRVLHNDVPIWGQPDGELIRLADGSVINGAG